MKESMKQNKMIFLNVDGVLNCMLYCERVGKHINPSNVQRLKKIVETTNAKLVLTHPWKWLWDSDENATQQVKNATQDLKQILVSELQKYNLSIAELTPESKTGNRAEEINMYLTEYASKHPDENLNYVILDGDCDQEDYTHYCLEMNLIPTNYFCNEEEGGIQDSHVLKAIELLGK